MLNTRFKLSVVTLLVLTGTLVDGASTGGVLTGLLLNKIHEFRRSTYAKRQGTNSSGLSLDDFPQQCQAGCQVAVNALNTCSLPSCICTSAVDASLDQCINCTVEAVSDPTVIQDGEKVFQDFNSLCAGTGVETLTLTGVTLSGTLSSTSAGGSSSFINPFLPQSTGATATLATLTTPTALGPTTTITAVTAATSSLASNTLGRPSTTASSTISNPLSGNDAVALPRASKAYVAIGLVVAFFMCLA